MCPRRRTGIFPEAKMRHAGEKNEQEPVFLDLLEDGDPFLQRKKGCASQIIPGAFLWKAFQHPQKRKFFAKKRKKSRHFLYKVF